MNKPAATILALGFLAGCGSTSEEPAGESPFFRAGSSPQQTVLVPARAAPEPPRRVVELPPRRQIVPERSGPAGPRLSPAELAHREMKRAIFIPNPHDFIGHTYNPPYIRDRTVEIFASAGDDRQPPDQVVVELKKGEELLSVEAPDTAMWKITTSFHMEDGEKVWKVIAKPSRAGTVAHVSVSTDERPYILKFKSFKYYAHVNVRFTYPEEDLKALNRALAKNAQPRNAAGNSATVLPACREGGYSIQGSGVPWLPQPTPDGMPAVCDDGERVRIAFPPNIGAIAAPSLFEVDADGTNARMTNYRVIGSNYVVDGTPRALLLREGVNQVLITKGQSNG